jgi:NAD(P)-dependent dehydrogenase (short-subunit alcohol dehydrogenase family)
MPDRSATVLITGASSGIGEATALRLVRAEWPVVATARRLESIRHLADAGCFIATLDVSDEASLPGAVADIAAKHGTIGVLVNNAGYSQAGALESLPMAKLRAQFDANLFGLVRLTQLVLPSMRAQGWGKVVNVSSMGGKLAYPGGGAYHASKHALEAISDVLRFEVAGFGIDVIVVEPGLVRTRFAEAALGGMDHAGAAGAYADFDAAVARITADAYRGGGAFGWLLGTPDDVARTIERAITAHRPRPRYRVAGAGLFIAARRLLGDRGWDAILRRVYPRPGR